MFYIMPTENVTAGVTIDCNGLVLTWSPVDGAQLYSVRLREKGADVGNVTVRVPVYRTSLSSDKIKDKEISLEVYTLFMSISGCGSMGEFSAGWCSAG